MALINARLDAKMADAAAAAVVTDTHVAQRRRDAQRDAPRDDPPWKT
jgi:hypothetical protein